MLASLRRWSHEHLCIVGIALLIASCATQLAPLYDKNIAEGLNSANTETMTLLAAASQGLEMNTFSTREEKYNNLIGKLDALALSAGARPMPKNNVILAINKLLEKRGGKKLDDDDSTPPSAHAIQKISETLTKMRDTDKKQGIRPLESQAFKIPIVAYFDQAITYENFLQR